MSWRRHCCCMIGEEEEEDGKMVAEREYLLPGGEWDPARAPRSPSSHSLRSEAGRDGGYVPPPVEPTRSLPTAADFKLLKTLGKGAFGKVMLSVHLPTRILYAVKVVPKARLASQKQINQLQAECRILRGVSHPFCISLQYGFQDQNFLFYVFEFAAGGMLFYHLRQEGKFTEPRARFYFGEIVLAMEYLHSLGIIFRDMKPENCMLSEIGHIVLTDFGSAKMLEVSEKTHTIAGTPQYIAPEVLRGEAYSYPADWWSCGILLHEMLTGKTPFHSPDRMELYKTVLRGDFRLPPFVSPRARSLLFQLINRDPDFRLGCSGGSERPSAREIREHSFFSQAPIDVEEEAQLAREEAERERHREALERSRGPAKGPSSFMETAGTVIRSFSVSTARRISSERKPYAGSQCEWMWDELAARQVTPPFKPQLSSPNDVRHFDPAVTVIPASLSDLVTTDRAVHLDDFDFFAPHKGAGSKLEAASTEASTEATPPTRDGKGEEGEGEGEEEEGEEGEGEGDRLT